MAHADTCREPGTPFELPAFSLEGEGEFTSPLDGKPSDLTHLRSPASSEFNDELLAAPQWLLPLACTAMVADVQPENRRMLLQTLDQKRTLRNQWLQGHEVLTSFDPVSEIQNLNPDWPNLRKCWRSHSNVGVCGRFQLAGWKKHKASCKLSIDALVARTQDTAGAKMDGSHSVRPVQCDSDRVVVLGKQVEGDLNVAGKSSVDRDVRNMMGTAYNHRRQFEPAVREFQRTADIHAAQGTYKEQGHTLMYVPITEQHWAVSDRKP